jgi:MFS family permease
MCLGMFVNRAGTFVVLFLTFYLRERLGLSIATATGAMGCLGAGSMCGALIGGHLADLYGRRVVMIAALVGSAAMLILLSAATSPPMLLAGVFFFALIADLYRPAASAMIADLVEPLRRPHAYGLMYVAINLGFAVGPLVGGLLASVSYTLLFYADAATSCAYALLILIALPETLHRASGRAPEDPASRDAGEPGFAAALVHILRDGTFMWFCAANLTVSLVYMQLMSTFPLYLRSLGFDAGAYGRIIAVNGILIVLGQLPVTALTAHLDRGLVLSCAAVFVALGFGLKLAAHSGWQFALAVAIWTVGEMMQASLISPIVADLAPAPLRARYMGLLSVSFSGASALGAPLGGWVLEHWGGRYVWAGSAASALLAAAIYLFIRRRIRRPGAARQLGWSS